MAATERRMCVSRRGMTVLGKVPKPINLPSQRSTFCRGSTGRLPNGGLSGKFESPLSDPVSIGDRLQSRLVTPSSTKNHGGGVDLQDMKMQSSSLTSGANFISSGASSTTTMAPNNVGKMEEPGKSTIDNCNSFESGNREMKNPSLQKGGDGCGRGVSVPPGFCHNGSASNDPRLGLSSTDSQCNGIGNAMHSETSQVNGSHSIPGMPYRSGTKDREIIVIHMVGGPGFYGNYPPQFGFPGSYNMYGGMFGNFPLQFGNFEPSFGLQGHGGAHLSPAAASEFFDEHDGFICYEKECYKGACHEFGRHRNNWVHGSHRENSFLGGVQGESSDSLIPNTTSTTKSRSLSQRHSLRNAGRSRSSYRTGRVVSIEETTAEPVSEKRITLLTKVSQHDAHAKNSLKETGGNTDAQTPVGPVCSAHLNQEFCEDEGKAPLEMFEARKVSDDIQVETSLADVSINLEMIDELSLPKECKVESNEVLSSKATCNDNCLHCKGAAVIEGPATLICQACEKTTVCESSFSISQCCLEPTEEVPVVTVEKDSSVDGSKADVKHVILNDDNHSTGIIKPEVASKEHESTMESNNCFFVSQSGKSDVLETVTGLSSDTSRTKSAKRKLKLVFKRKSQLKSMTKLGTSASKAHTMTKKLRFQGTNLTPAVSSNSSSDSKESIQVAKTQQDNSVQKSDSSPDSQFSYFEVSNSKMDTSMPLLASVKKNAERQQKLVYRKKVTEQAATGPQSSINTSETCQPAKPLSASRHVELGSEHEEDRVWLTPFASAFKYHIIRRRVYHVVEGSEPDFFLPTVPLSSSDNSKQQLEKIKEKIVSATAVSSHFTDSELISLKESESEIKSCSFGSKDTLHTAAGSLQPSRSPLWSSRQEDNVTKKHGKSGRPLSAWKPKIACQATGSGNSFIVKEREIDSPASAIVEAPEEKPGLTCPGLVGALNALNERNTDEKHSLGTLDEISLKLRSSNCGPIQCGENNQLSNQPDVEEKLVENSSESVVPKGEAKNVSPKNAGELPSLWLSACMIHNPEDVLAPKEVKQTTSQEIIVGGSKPFVRKKVMSFEKADRYHQMLFRRYKEVGQWKPKSSPHKKLMKSKEGRCANQDNTKASC